MTIKKLDELFADLTNSDDKVRSSAFKEVLAATEEKVEWIYDKLYQLFEMLSSDNSYWRSIGFMLLANLAKSDYENRIRKMMPQLINQLNDEKFITSRQCLQNVYKFGNADASMKTELAEILKNEFYNNTHLKSHANLIKQDIIFSLYNLCIHYKDENILNEIMKLIEEENDLKLKKVLKKIAKLK